MTGIQALPAPTDEEAVLRAIITMANAPRNAQGLAATREAMRGVPADAFDAHGGCLLFVACEIGCASEGRGEQSFGCQLLAMMLEGGTPPDVRSEKARTPLMKAANAGRPDMCQMLLDSGASASATDDRSFEPLHCACAGMEHMHGRVEAYEAVFSLLLQRGASPDRPNAEGMTPLMYCAQRLHGEELATETKFAEMLLAAGADLTFRTPPEARHLIGFSVVDYAVAAGDGSSTPVVGVLRKAAVAQGAETAAWLDEALVIAAWDKFLEEKIHPAHMRGTAAMVAAGVPMGEMVHGSAGTPAQNRASILQETGKAEAVVCTYAGFHADDVYDVVDNPLLLAYTKLMPNVPSMIKKVWSSRDAALTSRERGEIRRLWGHRREDQLDGDGAFLKSTGPHFVAKGLYQDWLLHIQMPLQHTYACSIPSEAAIDTLIALRTPIVEIGAGSGYWGAMLRSRGVECVLYDRAPPTDDGNNPFFGWQFTEVLEGDESKAALHRGHTLLLVWPYSDEEAAALGGESNYSDKDPWDVRALGCYTGSTVAHVGEMDELAHNITTSASFKRLLTASFEQVRHVPLPSWPHCNDALTVWRRRSGATAA